MPWFSKGCVIELLELDELLLLLCISCHFCIIHWCVYTHECCGSDGFPDSCQIRVTGLLTALLIDVWVRCSLTNYDTVGASHRWVLCVNSVYAD